MLGVFDGWWLMDRGIDVVRLAELDDAVAVSNEAEAGTTGRTLRMTLQWRLALAKSVSHILGVHCIGETWGFNSGFRYLDDHHTL